MPQADDRPLPGDWRFRHRNSGGRRPGVSAYGVIDGKPTNGKWRGKAYEISNMVEKPKPSDAPSNLAIIGRYVLTLKVFEMLERTQRGAGGEIQLTDGLRQLLSEEKIYGLRFEGKRHDAGDKLGFLQATVEFALKRADLGDEFRNFRQTRE